MFSTAVDSLANSAMITLNTVNNNINGLKDSDLSFSHGAQDFPAPPRTPHVAANHLLFRCSDPPDPPLSFPIGSKRPMTYERRPSPETRCATPTRDLAEPTPPKKVFVKTHDFRPTDPRTRPSDLTKSSANSSDVKPSDPRTRPSDVRKPFDVTKTSDLSKPLPNTSVTSNSKPFGILPFYGKPSDPRIKPPDVSKSFNAKPPFDLKSMDIKSSDIKPFNSTSQLLPSNQTQVSLANRNKTYSTKSITISESLLPASAPPTQTCPKKSRDGVSTSPPRNCAKAVCKESRDSRHGGVNHTDCPLKGCENLGVTSNTARWETCPTPGCDGSGNAVGTYSSHRSLSGCPRATPVMKRAKLSSSAMAEIHKKARAGVDLIGTDAELSNLDREIATIGAENERLEANFVRQQAQLKAEEADFSKALKDNRERAEKNSYLRRYYDHVRSQVYDRLKKIDFLQDVPELNYSLMDKDFDKFVSQLKAITLAQYRKNDKKLFNAIKSNLHDVRIV